MAAKTKAQLEQELLENKEIIEKLEKEIEANKKVIEIPVIPSFSLLERISFVFNKKDLIKRINEILK